jgi:hypothetical protein
MSILMIFWGYGIVWTGWYKPSFQRSVLCPWRCFGEACCLHGESTLLLNVASTYQSTQHLNPEEHNQNSKVGLTWTLNKA